VRQCRVWAKGLGLATAVVEGAREEPETGALVVTVRLSWRDRDRCGLCRRRCPGFDRGEGPRRWRDLDLGSTVTWLEAESPRVSCPEHGVVVTAVPWARHGARFTTELEDQVA
jgi:transposase